ncbi:MAG: hypothetical protein JO203_14845 [Gammaproteobacteria bacterium]|nr:hypothetical protein [Gammaproteobacteria bacterium]
MARTYRGLYVQRLNNGQIYNIKVAMPGGSESTVSVFDYQAREIEPCIDRLPDAEEYFARLSSP